MSRNAEEHKFLTPLQEKWALPFELRPSGGPAHHVPSLCGSEGGVGFDGARSFRST
jgi:hypothetical protein